MPDTGAPTHAADRLLDAVDRRGAPVCVGLDPVLDRLPATLRPPGDGEAAAAAIESFSLHVLDAVTPHVPCVKLQSACFERYRDAGFAALHRLLRAARDRELIVILDAKRGDIGLSAAHYAAAAEGADWVTVNPYMGADALRPFLQPGHGAFAVVRSSNPGGDAVQALRLDDGRTVAEAVAQLVAGLGEESVGRRGYSALGAVVGATKSRDAARLREIMPRQILLVPGFGAQGGGLSDVLPCFDTEGAGAIVTASRSVIYAFDDGSDAWADAIGHAARDLAETVGGAVGAR